MFGNETLCWADPRRAEMRCKKYGSRLLKETIAKWRRPGLARTVGPRASWLRSLGRLYKVRFWNSYPAARKRLKLWVREQGIDERGPGSYSLFFGRSKAFCMYLRASSKAPNVSSLV